MLLERGFEPDDLLMRHFLHLRVVCIQKQPGLLQFILQAPVRTKCFNDRLKLGALAT